MADGDLRDEIARIESEIEAHAESLERGRKIAAAAKVAIVGGLVWLLAAFAGLVGSGGAALLGAITAVIGGIVLSGSNASTAEQTAAALHDAEARRAGLIGMIDLRLVGDDA